MRPASWRQHVDALCRALAALPPAEAAAAADALAEVLARARAARLRSEILAAVAERPGSTSNTVAERVRGDRTQVLRQLRELERADALRFEPGAKGARLWFAAKTGRALTTGARARVA